MSASWRDWTSSTPSSLHSSPSSSTTPPAAVRETKDAFTHGCSPAGGSPRKWIVSSSVGTITRSPGRMKAGGMKASVIAASETGSDGRASRVRIQPPTVAGSRSGSADTRIS
jgi:hypothetical protein